MQVQPGEGAGVDKSDLSCGGLRPHGGAHEGKPVVRPTLPVHIPAAAPALLWWTDMLHASVKVAFLSLLEISHCSSRLSTDWQLPSRRVALQTFHMLSIRSQTGLHHVGRGIAAVSGTIQYQYLGICI